MLLVILIIYENTKLFLECAIGLVAANATRLNDFWNFKDTQKPVTTIKRSVSSSVYVK